MIKVIPYGDRKLTRKSLAKIWNLFPDEPICLTGIHRDLDKFKWIRSVASYYVLRGKDLTVEIDPIKLSFEVDKFLKAGVRKFYFPWNGIVDKMLFASSDVLSYAIWMVENYEDVEVTIVYQLPYQHLYLPPDFDLIETSILFLGRVINSKPRLKAVFRRPHPWYGEPRIERIEKLEKIALGQKNFTVEDKCGCLTVAPNTNIYCCPFCPMKKRKKNFGNADRDKFVIGTLDRGLFREIQCRHCVLMPNAKRDRIKYINRG